ncbi:glycosyltransferase [Flavobacterium adhaerens]|uniref:glycosyltransferase n=1 Tax=Flavobacterium adhaerens TaxID=3149043 RepID=UPI0032B3ADD1
MQTKTIKFTIFNEDFWNKGLIYSQNFLPLIKLKENYPDKYKIEVHVFCSLLDIILYNREIFDFRQNFKKQGIGSTIYPIFFVRSRLFVLRFFMLPFFYINLIPYLLYINIKDIFYEKSAVIYHLRSYPVSLIFVMFYKAKGILIFDPRSDYVNENKTVGFWSENSISDKLWLFFENLILRNVSKTIFISKPFMHEILNRNNIEHNKEKHVVYYNSVDYEEFNISSQYKRNYETINFLYTGSLGNWNNLETYLDFFLNIRPFFNNSKLIVATGTNRTKLEEVLMKDKYDSILTSTEFFYNLSYDMLPELYKECSVGLQIMNIEDSRLGVKFVEYLASGLLPVVNYNVLGSAEFCREGLGVIIERSDINDYKSIADKIKEKLNESLINNTLNSRKYFDVNITYKNLNLIYNN